jgi:hypothetical protein
MKAYRLLLAIKHHSSQNTRRYVIAVGVAAGDEEATSDSSLGGPMEPIRRPPGVPVPPGNGFQFAPLNAPPG